MTELLRVDSAALRAARPGVAALGDQLNAVLARLTEVLDGQGPCWGQDEAGAAFAGGYRPAEREVRAAFVRAATRLGELDAAVALFAEAVDGADDRARRRLA